jgi:hypothetical protein
MTEAMACGTPTLATEGINTRELALLTKAAKDDQLCVGTWDLHAPQTLTPLLEQCLAGKWQRARIDRGVSVARDLLDVDVTADALFDSPAWKRFVAN